MTKLHKYRFNRLHKRLGLSEYHEHRYFSVYPFKITNMSLKNIYNSYIKLCDNMKVLKNIDKREYYLRHILCL